jgi:hypothetical protein
VLRHEGRRLLRLEDLGLPGTDADAGRPAAGLLTASIFRMLGLQTLEAS